MTPSDPFAGLNLACIGALGQTVTFAPEMGDARDIQAVVTFPNPDGQRTTSQIVELVTDSSLFPAGIAIFDKFIVLGVTYGVYQTRTDEIQGFWVSCRRI